MEPKSEAKMLDMNSTKWRETAGSSKNMKETQEWHKKLAKEGYDGIMETNGEVIIFNPDKFKISEDLKKNNSFELAKLKEEYGKRPVQAFQSVADDNTIYR